MTKKEMKKRILALIEELNPDSEYLTEDPDIQAKIDGVMDLVQFELARMKKIPRYLEMEVAAGDLLDLTRIGEELGYEVYQLGDVRGVAYQYRANGTVLKILESGVAEISCFVYPSRIEEETPDDYELELTQDAQEIMPYGVAADLLKSDVSADYGKIYEGRYESMLQRLDPRYTMGSIRVEGGVEL